MKKQYTRLYAQLPRSVCVFLFSFFLVSHARAQQNVPVTGFNSDQVAEGTGAPTASTTAGTDGGVDGGGYVFVDGTYQFNGTCAPTTVGIVPASNQVASMAAPGLIYVLQPYAGNNALRIPATTTAAGSGTLTVPTPISVGALYLLSVSGGGPITSGLTITVNFTDLTTQTFTNRSAEDWCNANNTTGYTKITTTQYNRIQAPNVTNCNFSGVCQYFAEMLLQLDAANYTKQVASIVINKTTTGAAMNVYAVGMLPPCAAPTAQATGLNSTATTTGSISASFTAASPAASGYLVVRYPQNATPTAPANGTTYTPGQALGTGTVVQASTATTFISNNLIPNTPYDFYVYAYYGPCAPAASSPTYLTTTPLMATFSTALCSGSLSGVLGVGPGGTYTNLTAALAAVTSQGLSAATTLELLPGYDPTSETYPLTFPKDPCASSANSLTIRPSSGNFTPLAITSNSAVATIDLNGAKYVTFDGRPGGNGWAKMLSIINTNAAGVAIRFVNDASFNAIRFCDVQGQNTSANTALASAQVGVISFGTANSVTLGGNDSNTISYCDIHATTGGFPAIGIASYGNDAATPVSAWNEANTVDHCNIFDFFSATLASTAIKLHGGSHRFVISNNRIYQTASRTYTTANNHRAFWLTPTPAGAAGFIVTNNFIGGADSLGTGTYTMNGGNVATNYWGMDINHTGTIHTSVQGNTITSITLTNSATTANIFRGISTGSSGHMDIGTVNGNLIGSITANGAITLSNNSSGGTAFGIVNGGATTIDTVRIANNTIGGISITSATANAAQHVHGIGVTSAFVTYIDNNTVGSPTLGNSLYTGNAVTTNPQSAYGISVLSGTYTSVTNNRVSNITNNTASTSVTTNTSYTRGISLGTSTNSIVTGNTVHGIASGSISAGVNGTSSLVGIAVNTSNPSTVTANIVDSIVLMNNTTTNATNVDGMLIGLNGATPTHLVTRNFIHHIIVQRVGTSNAVINGLNLIGGANIVANNMIQLGLKPDGTSYDTSVVIRGLYMNNTGNSNLFHNTVYIGGTGVAANTKHTYAFARSGTSGTQQLRNNIFVNERSNATTGGKHYQVFLAATTGLSISNNVYNGTGTGSVFGSSNNGTSDAASIASGWINIDSNSVSADPHFIAPNGSSATVDLHINPSIPTSVESSGIATTITDDYDGALRSANTPVDIGADAGNFMIIGMSVDQTTVTQVTTGTLIAATNQAVIAVKVNAVGSVNPLQVTALELNTSGTSTAADLANARVYYTAGSNTFATTSPFGSVVANPNGTFYVSGSQILAAGVNHFWVAYDVSASATAGNFIDARIDSVGLSNGASANIVNGDPAGNRKISAPLSGNYNVGASQTYATITAALADLNLLGVSAPVTFTLTDASYSAATGETFPIALKSYMGASPANTVTFMPGNGVTALITGKVGNPIVRLDGGKYYRIDGRQGGSTMPKSLTIQNNDTLTGSAVDFVNDASFNMVSHTVIKGSCSNENFGVVNFGTGITTGNDSNTIEYCNITNGDSLPATLVQGRGSVSAETAFNNGNTIDHCELFNYFKSYGESNAFKISKGNTAMRITNNSIYQPVARKYPNGQYTFNWNRVVDGGGNADDAMAKASLNNMMVIGNYIGGTAPLCGGTPWTQDSSVSAVCSYLNLGEQGIGSFSKNTFANFNITSTSTNAGAPGAWNAIQYVNGRLNIDSNVIGSLTDSTSIRITAGNAATIFPIVITGAFAGTYSVRGNFIGGIRVGGRGPNSVNIHGILISGGGTTITFNVDSNNIGFNGIVAQPSSSTATAQLVTGISNTGTSVVNIRKNTIHNLINQHTSTSASQTIGIRSTGGLSTIANNLVDSMENNTAQTGTGANAAVIGISLTSTTGGSVIDRNLVYGIGTTVRSAAVTGIYYAGGTNDVLSRNMIHSLSSATQAAAPRNGIHTNGGTARIYNNMIRLGVNAAGQPETDTSVITGLNIGGGSIRAFFNTVYIGGTTNMGATNTFALGRTGTGTDSIYSNIFMNERSGGTGAHYAVSLSANTNLKANNNLYYTATAPLGLFNGTPYANIVAWKAPSASGVDVSSNAGNPALANPAGTLATVDLHIGLSPTPVEGGGYPVAGIDNDFDGDVRSSFTPTDIGADAGNFVLSDIFAPVISFTPIASDTVIGTLVLNNFATITDPSSVDISTNIPRIYYKKSTEDNVFGANHSGSNGWKYVLANNTTSPFSFVIDYSLLLGGTTAVGDTIQYFVTAQDLGGNVGSNPDAGFTGFSVSNPSTAPTTPRYYRIKSGPLNGVYNVGAGQTAPHFTSITAAAAKLNDVGVIGPVEFRLMDPLYTTGNGEIFPITINAYDRSSTINTVTIKPATGVTAVVAGNAAAIFKLNGADNVIIDGANTPGGTTRDLTLIDTSTASAIVWLASAGVSAGAENITIRNTTLTGNSSTATTTFGVYSAGTTIGSNGTGEHNHNLTVINNKINNVGFGVYAAGGSGTKHNTVNISNNVIGDSTNNTTVTVGNVGIYLSNVNAITIAGNNLLNIASTYLTNGGPHGISMQSGATNAEINNNVIYRVAYTGAGGYGGKGIMLNTGDANSNIEVRNNMIANIYGDGWSSFGADAILGIALWGNTGNVRVYYNSVTLTATSSGGTGTNVSAAFYAASGVTGLTVRNNIFYNPLFNSTQAGSRSFAIALDIAGTTGYTINNNNYLVAGAQGILGYKATVTPATIADWRIATTQDAASKNVAVNFVSVADLHLAGASNGDFNLSGAPLAGITTDIDGNTRNITFPYMGADEASIPLPVELITFTAKAKGGDVALTWVTASEKNNKGFEIERSADGKTFNKVGAVNGAGNSSRTITYVATDKDAFEKAGNGTLYYRLKQIDFNGRYTYSEKAMVSTEYLTSAVAPVAYPNPFANDLSVTFNAEKEAGVTLELVDLGGRVVVSGEAVVKEGVNALTLNNLSHIQPGLYLLKVTMNDQIFIIKVSRQ